MIIETAVNRIRQFHYRHRRMPSYQEMCKLFGFASKKASFDLAKKLILLGIIEKATNGRLKLKPQFLPLPVLGIIKVGSLLM